jgi:hypothetical protein
MAGVRVRHRVVAVRQHRRCPRVERAGRRGRRMPLRWPCCWPSNCSTARSNATGPNDQRAQRRDRLHGASRARERQRDHARGLAPRLPAGRADCPRDQCGRIAGRRPARPRRWPAAVRRAPRDRAGSCRWQRVRARHRPAPPAGEPDPPPSVRQPSADRSGGPPNGLPRRRLAGRSHDRPRLHRGPLSSTSSGCCSQPAQAPPSNANSFPPRSPDPHHLAVLATSRLCHGCSRPHRHLTAQTESETEPKVRQSRSSDRPLRVRPMIMGSTT